MGDNDGVETMIKLDSTNYSIWKSRMEDLLFCRGLYDPIEEKCVKTIGKSDGDLKKINRKTIGVIKQWINQSIYHHVSGENLSYNLLKRLSELFESKNSLNKAFLIRKIVNLKYKDGSSMAEHLSSFQNMVNQLTTMEIILDDELLALLLLSSLLDSWKTLVVSLSNSDPKGKFTFDMVKYSLLNEEIRRKGSNKVISSSQNEALVMESRGRCVQEFS